MKITSILILGFCLISVNVIYAQVNDTLIIENVNVIPMNEEIVNKNQRVIISKGKILKIEAVFGQPVSASENVIDGTGKYLIPGLSEMHYHYRDEARDIESEFKLLMAHGITTVRNMAAYQWHETDHVVVKNNIKSEVILGPNYYTTGPYLKSSDLQNSEKIIETVKIHKEKGYDFIKLADNLPKHFYLELLDQANKNGIDVIGHAQRKLPLEFSLRMKSIEHVEEFIYILNKEEDYSYLLNDEKELNKIASQIKISGAYVAPTLVVFRYITQSMDDENFASHQNSDLKQYLTPGERKKWLTEENEYRKMKGLEINGVQVERLFSDYFAWMKKFTKILADNGVYLLSGSDTFGMVIPGFSLHDEFELLQEAGLSPYEILLTSTVNPARYLNAIALEGTITEGKNANLVLLDENPLEDIRNTRTIDGVILKGVWFSKEDLDGMLNGYD